MAISAPAWNASMKAYIHIKLSPNNILREVYLSLIILNKRTASHLHCTLLKKLGSMWLDLSIARTSVRYLDSWEIIGKHSLFWACWMISWVPLKNTGWYSSKEIWPFRPCSSEAPRGSRLMAHGQRVQSCQQISSAGERRSRQAIPWFLTWRWFPDCWQGQPLSFLQVDIKYVQYKHQF